MQQMLGETMWIYKNGGLHCDGKLVAEFFNVVGKSLGQQDTKEQTNTLGCWLAEIANQAEEQGNKP